nr:MAG TPA: hypothetical protein [Caudoviricetes sp.]
MTLQLLLRLYRHSPHSSPLWGSTWHTLGAFLFGVTRDTRYLQGKPVERNTYGTEELQA